MLRVCVCWHVETDLQGPGGADDGEPRVPRVHESPSLPASTCQLLNSSLCRLIRNETVPVQLAQCWFPRLAISNAKHTHTRLTSLFPGLPGSAGTRKVKTDLDFTEARDSEWQWHQLGYIQVCTCSRQITMPSPHHSVFLQAGCPSCHPANSVKALKAHLQC